MRYIEDKDEIETSDGRRIYCYGKINSVIQDGSGEWQMSYGSDGGFPAQELTREDMLQLAAEKLEEWRKFQDYALNLNYVPPNPVPCPQEPEQPETVFDSPACHVKTEQWVLRGHDVINSYLRDGWVLVPPISACAMGSSGDTVYALVQRSIQEGEDK